MIIMDVIRRCGSVSAAGTASASASVRQWHCALRTGTRRASLL